METGRMGGGDVGRSVVGRRTGAGEQVPRWLGTVLAANSSHAVYVPDRLARAIFLHVTKNLDVRTSARAAVLLCVVGPFGSGKSVIVDAVLERLRVHIERLSASSFESRWAGEPPERIQQAYLAASKQQTASGEPCALLVDDIDLAVGHFDGTTATVNTQHALSALMEIADRPTRVAGERVERIPILATANDITKVYGAVTRSRRARVFCWNPNREEVGRVVGHILKGYLTPARIARLVEETPEWTVAHYGQLASVLDEALIEREVADMDAAEYLLRLLRPGKQDQAACNGLAVTEEMLAHAVQQVLDEEAAKVDYTKPRK